MPDASSAEPSCPSPPLLPGTKQLMAAWAGPSSWNMTQPSSSSLDMLCAPAEQPHPPVPDRTSRDVPCLLCCSQLQNISRQTHAAPRRSDSGKPGGIEGGFGFHTTCCPVGEPYQEKITLPLDFCNPSWCVASLWLLSTVDYGHKLTPHLFNYFFPFLFFPDPGWDLCVPLIDVSQ